MICCCSEDGASPSKIIIFKKENEEPSKIILSTDISPNAALVTGPIYRPKRAVEGLSGDLWPFQLVLNTGKIIQFCSEYKSRRTAWVRILEVMIMFPRSQIPPMPLRKHLPTTGNTSISGKQFVLFLVCIVKIVKL